MRRYDLGDPVTFRKEMRDADGALMSGATAVLVVTRPDGSTKTPPVTYPEDGIADSTLPIADANQYGSYRYVWTVTGAVDDVSGGQFYIAAADTELPPLAPLERLGRKLGYTPEGSEADRASDILDSASELIRDAAGKTWVDADTGVLQTVPRRVISICVEVAYRAFGNPEGLSQRSIGDSSKSYDRAKREGGEAVYLTKAEEEAIRKASGSSSLVSVTLVSPYGGALLDPWDEVTAE